MDRGPGRGQQEVRAKHGGGDDEADRMGKWISMMRILSSRPESEADETISGSRHSADRMCTFVSVYVLLTPSDSSVSATILACPTCPHRPPRSHLFPCSRPHPAAFSTVQTRFAELLSRSIDLTAVRSRCRSQRRPPLRRRPGISARSRPGCLGPRACVLTRPRGASPPRPLHRRGRGRG